MFKTAIVFIASLFFVPGLPAQDKGILPLTGLRYFKEGIQAKQIDIKIGGSHLLSNRIPLNKEVTISLVQPLGFTVDKKKTVFAGIELIILTQKGDLLFKNPNILKANELIGFTPEAMKELTARFMLDVNTVRAIPGCTVQLRYYDLKGKNQLRIDFPIAVARAGEQLQLSKSFSMLKADDGSLVWTNGVKFKKTVVTVDTSLKVAPKMAYTSLEIFTISGSTLTEIFGGKESFWVYDKDLNQVKITDILLKQAKGAMENNFVDYTLKVPYRLKTMPDRGYTVRFRWESEDKRKVIDIVVNK